MNWMVSRPGYRTGTSPGRLPVLGYIGGYRVSEMRSSESSTSKIIYERMRKIEE
jgi:hypothetical protein